MSQGVTYPVWGKHQPRGNGNIGNDTQRGWLRTGVTIDSATLRRSVRKRRSTHIADVESWICLRHLCTSALTAKEPLSGLIRAEFRSGALVVDRNATRICVVGETGSMQLALIVRQRQLSRWLTGLLSKKPQLPRQPESGIARMSLSGDYGPWRFLGGSCAKGVALRMSACLLSTTSMGMERRSEPYTGLEVWASV
jgi:hypothetical protein